MQCTYKSITADCSPTDLKVDLPDGQVWRDLQNTVGYEFDGGNVTFNGIMNGSIATYTTYGDYLVSGGQTFHTTCHNNQWIHLPTIDITGFIMYICAPSPISLPSLSLYRMLPGRPVSLLG